MSSEVREQPQIEAVREAFEQEFGRFARFRGAEASAGLDALKSSEAETLLREVGDLRTRHTGKKSALANLKKMIGRVAPEQRAAFGQQAQQLEATIIESLEEVESLLGEYVARLRVERERIDVTLPGRRPRRGHQHPITLIRQRIEDIFVAFGYTVEDGPEIETDFYNFDALNIPQAHPARSPQDTFYTSEGFALRSQTSTVQIHAMQRRKPPLRVIAPGKVFRRDTPDATHNPMFFQLEGLLVDRGITMGHLKGTVTEFLRRLYGPQTRTRFRPSYFPFTEPSAEFDFSCFKCNGAGCRLCKGSGWIELGGSGMVHPNVLRAVGIDPQEFSGFAFGFGIDRMCMLNFGLDDIRLLFENDVRFLEQFN
ncbi:MAG TPA: phenylalanine--tRNA ligase subunit alpha [Pyrinomonadaceae bacterium]|jgi:phenylalanyl-tRNA synthetase alpha chain|nr:phenylalanine--tRNA ligase subunit alpha [Pyrinomonadaceae bacterium]